ncbi:MAG: hypothetical protein R3C11_28870 [Planctomycetaceae bacterium]
MDELDPDEEITPDLGTISQLVEESEPRNFASLIAHQVSVRVAWVFKTESVFIPAFLDSISGAAWVRSWLPVLNRIGQSFAPLWLADRIQTAPQKKGLLLVTTWLMGLPWILLAIMLWNLKRRKASPVSRPSSCCSIPSFCRDRFESGDLRDVAG